jgi:DHA1 family bicyclomycin/chloramphenicol resistance-like MFS transporter
VSSPSPGIPIGRHSPSYYRNAVVLGLVSAVGPFAIDMYLPALPSIGGTLGGSPAAVQMSLTVFFIALSMGQLIYGPIADMVGRKPPLYAGLGLFALASIGCALAPDTGTLIALRFFEGLGACAGMVMPLAIARDLYTGAEAARMMSLVMLVFSISPILAPLAGSFVIASAGWRAVFWSVTGAAILAMALVALFLPETRSRAMRIDAGFAPALRGYALLLRDRRFVGTALIGAFGIASFFAFLANSSFVMIGHYGLTPSQYGLTFSLNAASFIGAAQFNGLLTRRFGLRRVVRTAVIGSAAAMTTLLAITFLGCDRLDLLMALLMAGYGCLGLVNPTIGILALEPHGPIAGTASALLGTIEFIVGSIVMAVVGYFADGRPLPMIAGIALCALLTLGLALITLRGQQTATAPAD